MSIESAKAFIERVTTDEDFKNRVQAAEDKEARFTLVKSEGFDFSTDDLNAITGELSDEELERVSAADCYDFEGFLCDTTNVGFK